MVFKKLKNLFRARSSSSSPVYPLSDRSAKTMQDQIQAMFAENSETMTSLDDIPEIMEPVPTAWVDEPQEHLQKNPLPLARSQSMLELRSCFFEESQGVTKEVKQELLASLQKWAQDCALVASAPGAAVPPHPYRIVAVGPRYYLTYRTYISADRLRGISDTIENFVVYSAELMSRGSALFPTNAPNFPFAVMEENPTNKIYFKRVRYLGTVNVYDIFFEFDTGNIREIRFDKTRVYKMPGYLNFFNCNCIKVINSPLQGHTNPRDGQPHQSKKTTKQTPRYTDWLPVVRVDPRRMRRTKSVETVTNFTESMQRVIFDHLM